MNRDVLLTTTRDKFLQAFMLAVERALPRTATTLLRIAEAAFSVVEQRRLLCAYDLYRNSEDDLNQQMRSSMEQLLNRSFETTYSTFRPSFLDTYGSAGLALVDTAVHEDLLRINEVTGHFRHAADSQLRDLNMRIAILFEQDRINERENPFRPFLVSRALATAIDNLGQSVEVSSTLFDQLAEDMRVEITTIYDAINAHLASHGIAAQLQLRIQKSGENTDLHSIHDSKTPMTDGSEPQPIDIAARALSSDTPRNRIERLVDRVRQIARPLVPGNDRLDSALPDPARAGDTSNSEIGSNGSSWIGAQGLVATLQKLFSRAPANLSLAGAAVDTSDPFDPSGNRSVSGQLHDSLDVLITHGVPQAGQMALASGDLRNLIFEQREALSTVTTDTHEQMTIDVVAMLFEFILRDPQIPAEVRAQLGRLQFLVLKVALRESTLLTHKNHPARLLVNRIGAISVGLQQVDPAGARISAEISRIVDALLSDLSENAQLFTVMLDQFEAFIAQELRGSDGAVDLAVQALEKAQNRTLRFVRISAGLADALGGLNIDPFLRDFLATTWVRVIERAERRSGMNAQRFRQLVPDLLWSIIPKNTPAQRSKLIGMLPGLVHTLREGMLQENMPGIDRLAVLNWLVDIHSRALRGTDAGGPDLPLETMQLQLGRFTREPDGVSPAAPAAPQETMGSDPHQEGFLAEALQETNALLELLDPLIAQNVLLTTPLAIEPEISDVLARLRNGVTIHLTLGSTPGTGRLHWIDPDSTTLLLLLDGHPAPSMMTVRMFLRLLVLGRVGLSEAAPLFERAVHALMLSAQQLEKVDEA